MKRQRASLKSGRKKGLRLAAAILAFCLLATSGPDIAVTFSSYVQAAGDGAAAGKADAGQGAEGTGSIDSAGGETPGWNGTQTPGNGDGGSAGDGNDAGGTGAMESPEGGDGTQTPGNGDSGNSGGGNDAGGTGSPESPEGGEGTEKPGSPEGGEGTEKPGSPEGGNGAETPENPEGGDGAETPGNPEGGDGAETPENPEGGDGMGTPENPEDGDGAEALETPKTPDREDDTDEALADIDIDSLPDTEEAWDAYLESLDEETRAIEEPMEVFATHTFEAAVPAVEKYAGSDGFAKRHKMRVVWVNDKDDAIAKTALSAHCSKSYVCVRLPDKGGTQVKKCYFNKSILTDKSGKESVLAEFTLPDSYEDGDPFPTDVGMYSAISMLVGRPSGTVRLELYDFVEKVYRAYYSVDLKSGGAVLGGILAKEEWLGSIERPDIFYGYGIYGDDARIRLKPGEDVTAHFGVSLADNCGVALPYQQGDWVGSWFLQSGTGEGSAGFPGSRYHVSVMDSDLNGVTLTAGPEAGAAELDGISLYVGAQVRYQSGRTKSFSFPVLIDSDAVRCKVQYAGADGSYIRTDIKNHNSEYVIRDLRNFSEVDDSWKALFDGSYTGTDGKTYRAGEAYTGNTSLGLFPNWEKSLLTLTLDATFDQNGQYSAGLAANGRETIRVAVGEKYKETAPIPEKAPAGYEFAGYYTEKAGQGKRYFDGTGRAVRACDLLEDTTLYAGWREKNRKIVYRLDACLPDSLPPGFGGLAWTEYEISDCLRGDTLAKKGLRLPEEEKDEVWRRGFRLEGWYTEKTGGDRVTNTTALPVEEDSYTFYAHWTPVECTMIYDANGGVFNGGTRTAKVRYGEPYGTTVTTAAPVPVRNGYRFMGYGIYKGTLTPLREDDMVYASQSFTVYAVWATEVTVNLDAEGGTLAAGQLPYIKGMTGQRITIPNPSRTGYTFTSWKDEKDRTSGAGMNNTHYYTIPADAGASVTLKACWVENIYRVRFQKNAVSGVSGDMGEQTFTCGKSAALTACAYTRTGYTFAGWNTKEDGSGTSYADRATVRDLSTEAGGSVDLYAQWKPEPYTVRFDACGGTLAAGQEKRTVTFGSAYGTLPVTTRAKYTFLGWYTEKTGGDLVEAADVVERAAGHTLYAHWDYAYVTLSFDLQGGSGTAAEPFLPREIKKTGENLPAAKPVLAGLDFAGWSRTAGGTAAYQAGEKVIWQADGQTAGAGETMTLYAVWTTDKPHVSYNANCEDASVANMPPSPQLMTAEEISKGEVKLSDKTPTRTGYTFRGWARTAEDGTSVDQPGKTVKTKASMTLYAVWEEEIGAAVSLTLMDGGRRLSQAFYPVHTEVPLPAAGLSERKNGEKTEAFAGWQDKDTGRTYRTGDTLRMEKAVTLHALWTDVSSCECRWRASETEEWSYGTLEAADAALTGGGEAVMLKDKIKEQGQYISLSGTYTLDLSGKKISNITMSEGKLIICNGRLIDNDENRRDIYIYHSGALKMKGTADVILRDMKIITSGRLNHMVCMLEESRLTVTGNTYLYRDTDQDTDNTSQIIWVEDSSYLTIEYAEMDGMSRIGLSDSGGVRIKDGFLRNVSRHSYDDGNLAQRIVVNLNTREPVITGGCFANCTGLMEGKIIHERVERGPIIYKWSTRVKRTGEEAVDVSPRYGNISYAGPWYRVAGTGSSLPDIWEINGNKSSKTAHGNDDMQAGKNTFRLISALGKTDGSVNWTQRGSLAEVDLGGYTYDVKGGFTMTGGMEGENGSIRNGILKAGGTAAITRTHLAADLAVKADRITLDRSDTIEAGARFYAKNEISQLVFEDIVLVRQNASDDGSYSYYYIAMPWETSGTAPKESVTFHSNYPADSAGTAGTAAKEQTRGAKWSLPSRFREPTGFTFYEWNTKADGSGSRVAADVIYDSTVKEVYAVWKRENVTVTFDLNGGGRTPAPVWMEGAKETGTRLIPYNYPVGNPPAAKFTGYILEGWYDTGAATGGTKFTENTKATGAKTYYARWKAAVGTAYTVKYRVKGTQTLLGQKEFYGTTGAQITVDTIKETFTGYTYSSWDGGGKTIAADGSTVVTLDYALKTNPVEVTVMERAASGTETALSGVSMSITGGGSGSGSSSTSGNVTTKSGCAYGSTVTLTAGGKTGYEFVEWKGDQTGANQSLSFAVPDLLAGTVVSVTAVYRKKTCPAAYDLKNIEVTAEGGGAAPGSLSHGSALSVRLTAQTGYELPEAGAVSVTVGGTKRNLQTAGSAGDTYVKNSGGTAVLTVRNVTGALVVAAAGVPKDMNVTFLEKKAAGQTDSLIGAKSSAGGSLPVKTAYGTSCTVILTPKTGYALPDTIAVYTAVGADGSGGTALTAGTDYHYDATNGTVFLPEVTGDTRIEAGAVPSRDTLYRAVYYQMTEDGGYEEGTPYETAYLTGQTGTQIDVDALAGQKNYDGYTYDTFAWETGAGTPVIAADGSTVVKLYYKRNQYTLTVKTQTKASGGSDAWTDWTGMEAAGAANPYYYRGRVDIDLGGLPDRKGYDRDGWMAFDADGWAAYENWLINGRAGDAPAARYRGKNARIAIRMPDSDLVAVPVYTPQRLRVSDEELTHVAFVGEPEAWYEQPFAAQLEADSGYSLPDRIAITIGEGAEKAVLEDGDFTYDKDTGRVEISAKEKVTGTITIRAEGVRQERTQTVFLRYADGLTQETSHLRLSRETGTHTVTYNGRFSLALTPERGYVLPESLTLTVGVDDAGNGGDAFTAGTDSGSTPAGTRISYDQETGMLSVLSIRDNVLILIPEAPESSGEPVPYTVEHYRADEEGGYVLAAVSYREALAGTAITEEELRQEQKNYTGYAYAKYEWQTGSGAGEAQTPVVAADGSTVVKMYYDMAEYELTVVMEEGLHGGISGQSRTEAAQTARYHYGDSIELELTEVAAGRSYRGWHIDGEPVNTGWHYAFAMPARDMTVVAKSDAAGYELMAYGSHGKAKIPEEEEEGYLSQIAYETEKKVTILPDAHYSLPEQVKILVDDGERQVSMGNAGSRNTGDGDTYIGVQDGKSGEITLTVRGDTAVEFEMVPDTYLLTLDPAGGKLEQTTLTLTYGEPYGELPVPERKGYDFLGWYSAAEEGTKVEAKTELLEAGDHTLYAQWKKRPVKKPDEKPDKKKEEPDLGGTEPAPETEPGGGTESAPGGKPEGSPKPEAGKAVLDGDEFVVLSTEDEAVRESTEDGRENAYDLGAGRITVEVNCMQDYLTASVRDTSAVINNVLSAEQRQMAQSGQSIRIRMDVTDISDQVPPQDKEAVETGIEAYRETYPKLTPGMYIDISLFIRIGDGDWERISAVREPIEVVVGIPENLRREGRTFYIIRVHEGEYVFMEDRDETEDTVTISTDRFSTYAVLYERTEEGGPSEAEEKAKCGLCHICPTFLGICYFIWLVLMIAVIILVLIILRRKREEDEEQTVEK